MLVKEERSKRNGRTAMQAQRKALYEIENIKDNGEERGNARGMESG